MNHSLSYHIVNMKRIQYIGFSIFLGAFTLFIFTLSLSHYKLTNEVLQKTISKGSQGEVMLALAPMNNKEYSTNFDFISDLKVSIAAYNKPHQESKEWDKVLNDTYLFSLTKASSIGFFPNHSGLFFLLSIVMGVLGALVYILPNLKKIPGIKNNHIFFHPNTSRGWIGIALGAFLILFYIVLYFWPEYITNWAILVDPLSKAISGKPASQWFVYGLLYTLCIVVMGIRMLIKYRHSRYQQVRTISVMFFQTSFAFLIPEILVRLNAPYQDLKNMWPLDYSFFFDYRINEHLKAGNLGLWMFVWGVVLFAIGVPLLTYFFGKRWYCSWVCGCGGLAETLGDPYRHLSNKTVKAWKIERWMVHSVLVFAVVMTAGVLYTYFTGSGSLLGMDTYSLRAGYGFAIGSIFAGVVGTGFYPLMGNRVWCRFGCPLAAYLGFVQRFKSRFRITTNGGQCISCGNCSTYCEMGIDVRWYAQRGQDIVRSSCVGCGICSEVCPRGVLKLENGKETQRLAEPEPIVFGNDGRVRVNL